MVIVTLFQAIISASGLAALFVNQPTVIGISPAFQIAFVIGHIGQHWTTSHNFGASHSAQGSSSSGGGSDSLQYKLIPSAFTTLRKGGPPDRIVEAYVFQSGRIFQDTGDTYQKVQFKQGKE